jgi:hypothetical protein
MVPTLGGWTLRRELLREGLRGIDTARFSCPGEVSFRGELTTTSSIPITIKTLTDCLSMLRKRAWKDSFESDVWVEIPLPLISEYPARDTYFMSRALIAGMSVDFPHRAILVKSI